LQNNDAEPEEDWFSLALPKSTWGMLGQLK